MVRTLSCLLLASLLVGCARTQFGVPTQAVVRAGVRGTVVDARTGRPVSGVVVCVENATSTPDLTPQEATTWSGDDGTFRLRAKTLPRSWRQYRSAQGTASSPLFVSRTGYATRRLELRTSLFTDEPGANVNAGRIELQPVGSAGRH